MEPIELREFRSRIGRAIRTLREEEGISANFLAKVLGVTQPTISRIENGTTSITADKLCFLAKSYNKPLSYFIGERSPILYDHDDILRAGLVYYGARHLKSKRTIDIQEHYKTYADFLKDSLSEVDDPRFAAALATTLYCQAFKGKLNENRIISTVQQKRLIANLEALLVTVINNFYIKAQLKEGERIQKRLRNLLNEITKAYGDNRSDALVAHIEDLYLVNFIKESLGNV